MEVQQLLYCGPEGERRLWYNLKRTALQMPLQKLNAGRLKRGCHIINMDHIVILIAAGEGHWRPLPRCVPDEVQYLGTVVARAVGVGQHQRDRVQQSSVHIVGR